MPDTSYPGRADAVDVSGVATRTRSAATVRTASLEQHILNAIEQAVIATDERGYICYWNAAAERLYGWSAAEVIGELVTNVTPADAVRSTAHEIMRTLLAGRSFQGEFLVRRRDGTTFLAMVVDSPTRNDAGEQIGVVGVSWPLSGHRDTAEALAQARAEAAQAARAQHEFLGVMSHELRTPLTAIVGYQELLDSEISGPLTDQQRQHLSRIRASSWYLLDLVEQMLSLTRIDAGNEELRLELIDVSTIAREATQLIEPQLQAKRLSLTVRDSGEQVMLHTDAAKLRQILFNLLNNAIKFTEQGGITVTTLVSDENVTFRVSDTGIGIGADERTRIFEPFVQLKSTATRTNTGVGLGLAVVQRIVALLGGSVEVESSPGAGSTFSVTLPR